APRPDVLLRPGTSNSLEHGEWFAAAKCRAQSEWGPGAAGLADRGNRGCSSVSFYCMKHNCELCVNTFLHFPLCGYSETGGGQGCICRICRDGLGLLEKVLARPAEASRNTLTEPRAEKCGYRDPAEIPGSLRRRLTSAIGPINSSTSVPLTH